MSCCPRRCRYVGRKAIKPQAFPITRWEFYGATSLVEITGYLDISTPGAYDLGISSEDRFVVWLQDWWLHMQEAAPGEGLAPGWWRQRVNFASPGELNTYSAAFGCCCMLSAGGS